jgi:1,2-dihydroxy-3-keto-5-methylthiopentene dioxygenase
MAALVSFDADGRWGRTLVCEQRVREALQARGLQHGRWPLREPGADTLESVLATYGAELGALREQLAVRGVDRVRLHPGHDGWPALRQQFLAEHVHADPEIRFFLDGAGLFYLRTDDGYLGLLCEAGDWVVVPAGTPHAFDAGEQPDFDALRLFASPEGWRAQPTGTELPEALPRFDAFRDHLIALLGEAVD